MGIKKIILAGCLGVLGGLSLSAHADWEVNLMPGVTEISRSVYDLHMIIFWVCVAIAVVVFGVMFWSMFHHRKSRGAKSAHFHENTTVEVIWTIIPVGILVAMAVPSAATLIEMYDPSEAEIDIQVTGYQWKWKYDYLDEEISYFSNLSTPRDQIYNAESKGENYLLEVDNHLVVPVDTKIRFLLTANDVIHSWWVPELAVKKDAIPGFINEAWTIIDEPGIYRGQCTELCGKDHGYMPVVVEAVSKDDYASWVATTKAAASAKADLASKSWTLDELMTEGEQVYLRACAACHQPNGEGLPGAFPALKGSPIAVGDVAAHIDIVVNGKPGTAMQAYKDQLSAVEMAAVITYERNAWGNNTGEAVTPAQLADMQWGMEQLMAKGEEVYLKACAACHQPNGQGLPGAFPSLVGTEIVKGDIAKHIDIVVNGKAGSAMQAFKDQLSAEEIAAVVTYERNAWGNNGGDSVKPSVVASWNGGAK
ncbi:MAG: cytochrome c oxidase subunit II [Oceanospirillaceae bacterium]|nr:cytochrome c oxidase subunit II [Oceanospirillaceae bacterium]